MSVLERKAIYGLKKFEIDSLRNSDWDFSDELTQAHLHTIHPYPARFIPQIPRKAIKLWSKPSDIILDPFCGCGTTILESIMIGRPAIGIDNNDVAVLVSKAKTAKYSSKDIHLLKKLNEKLGDGVLYSKNKLNIPEYQNIDYWFSSLAKNDLGRLKNLIEDLPPKIKQIALAILSSIIVRVSNQDSDTRYTRVRKTYMTGQAIKWYKENLISTINIIEEVKSLPREKARIYCSDSRKLANISAKSISLIVTSPPYINAYDYHKYHRHRLYWTNGNVALARDTEIGKHDTFTRPNADPKRYFKDMTMCFKEWLRVLKPRGKVFIVVGDGIVNGKPVESGQKFINICKNLGLKHKEHWIRRINQNKKSFNQSARINMEHLLLFEK